MKGLAIYLFVLGGVTIHSSFLAMMLSNESLYGLVAGMGVVLATAGGILYEKKD